MRGITYDDLNASLNSIRGSITSENMKAFHDWNSMYGDCK